MKPNKKLIMVQHADGKREYICPKCDAEMKHVETGRIGFCGEYEDSIREFLTCPECGMRQEYPKLPTCAFRSLGTVG